VWVSTRPRHEQLKLIVSTLLGLEALLFLVLTIATAATGGGPFVALVLACVLGFLAWLGLRSPGSAGGCLVALGFAGFLFVFLGTAFSGGTSLGQFLLGVVLLSFIPLTEGLLFLVARRKEPHQNSSNASGRNSD